MFHSLQLQAILTAVCSSPPNESFLAFLIAFIVSLRRGAVGSIPAGFFRLAKFLVRGLWTYGGAFYSDKRSMAGRHSGVQYVHTSYITLQIRGMSHGYKTREAHTGPDILWIM